MKLARRVTSTFDPLTAVTQALVAPEARVSLIWPLPFPRRFVVTMNGLEQAPVAVNRLFEGANIGKLVVRVAPE